MRGQRRGLRLGLAKNTRLIAAIAAEPEQARQQFERDEAAGPGRSPSCGTGRWTAGAASGGWWPRPSTWPRGPTRGSWSRRCRPRIARRKPLYEEDYCGRGEMENRIKEQQLHLFADRTSAATMRANQIRLFFSSIAYVLLEALRRLGLAGTELAEAQCQTIRLKLLKIGALVRVTVRKVWVKLSSGSPYAEVFRRVHANLARLRPPMLRC